MILRDVRTYLEQHRRATLGDLALHFRTSPDAMRGMLDTWTRKGVVRELAVQASCNVSCPIACDDASMTIYEFVGDHSAPPRTASFTSLPMLDHAAPVATCRQAG